MEKMQVKTNRSGMRVREGLVNSGGGLDDLKSREPTGRLRSSDHFPDTILRAVGGFEQESGLTRMRLILFTRYPEPGKTKTRLIPALGPERAARLHKHLTERTLTVARQLEQSRGVSIEIRWEGGSEDLFKRWLGGGLSFEHQGEGDLGARMARAVREAFDAGMRGVIVIGSDCPGLTVDVLEQAADSLRATDVVLGPAADGGYYLFGLSRELPSLFEEIPWGTAEVLLKTIRRASERGLRPVFLRSLGDIDRPEDLQLLERLNISVE